jgi:hypothetical protein
LGYAAPAEIASALLVSGADFASVVTGTPVETKERPSAESLA